MRLRWCTARSPWRWAPTATWGASRVCWSRTSWLLSRTSRKRARTRRRPRSRRRAAAQASSSSGWASPARPTRARVPSSRATQAPSASWCRSCARRATRWPSPWTTWGRTWRTWPRSTGSGRWSGACLPTSWRTSSAWWTTARRRTRRWRTWTGSSSRCVTASSGSRPRCCATTTPSPSCWPWRWGWPSRGPKQLECSEMQTKELWRVLGHTGSLVWQQQGELGFLAAPCHLLPRSRLVGVRAAVGAAGGQMSARQVR
mmetsp:Transcript_4923/g.12066  ORF Transcript_4923/g.12066 Transcript_4923/m.12066 type:complete len:258 (-) Transcript_4923:144-917(-)